MKFHHYLLLPLLVGSASAAVIGQHDESADPLEPKFFKALGAQRVKSRYGPFLVPSIRDEVTRGMKNFTVKENAVPCTDCFITHFTPDLEFSDGTVANANNGMWLHHVAWLNPAKNDTTCPRYPDRWIASGNERSVIDLTRGGTLKTGYRLAKDDRSQILVDLMNEAPEAREAYITVEWEFVPASTPDFRPLTIFWLDISGSCGSIAVEVPAEKKFNYSLDPPWKSNITGEIVETMGHLHDGGSRLVVSKNGKEVCQSIPNYGESEGFITHVGMFGEEEEEEHGHGPSEPEHEHAPSKPEHEHSPGTPEHEHGRRSLRGRRSNQRDLAHPPGEQEHEHPPEEEEHGHPPHDHNSDAHILHISSMVGCESIARKVEVGDLWSITSYYDIEEHTAMAGHHGGFEPVMGIFIVYVMQ